MPAKTKSEDERRAEATIFYFPPLSLVRRVKTSLSLCKVQQLHRSELRFLVDAGLRTKAFQVFNSAQCFICMLPGPKGKNMISLQLRNDERKPKRRRGGQGRMKGAVTSKGLEKLKGERRE